MIQHITPEQVWALTGGQRVKLLRLWRPREGDRVSKSITHNQLCVGVEGNRLFFQCESSKPYYNYLPLLTIGQMIELLSGRNFTLTIEDNLIDALWEALKEVL